jgi:hypothetical protein
MALRAGVALEHQNVRAGRLEAEVAITQLIADVQRVAQLDGVAIRYDRLETNDSAEPNWRPLPEFAVADLKRERSDGLGPHPKRARLHPKVVCSGDRNGCNTEQKSRETNFPTTKSVRANDLRAGHCSSLFQVVRDIAGYEEIACAVTQPPQSTNSTLLLRRSARAACGERPGRINKMPGRAFTIES